MKLTTTQLKLVSKRLFSDVVVAPVMIHIPLAKLMIKDGVYVAAQNCSKFAEGAYTGEVAASALVDFGIQWVIIGHSERRTLFGEDDATVAKKVELALASGLNVILCIGETESQRDAAQTNDVLTTQLTAVKDTIKDWSKVVIAYEPVWAIGTGKTATTEQA